MQCTAFLTKIKCKQLVKEFSYAVLINLFIYLFVAKTHHLSALAVCPFCEYQTRVQNLFPFCCRVLWEVCRWVGESLRSSSLSQAL